MLNANKPARFGAQNSLYFQKGHGHGFQNLFDRFFSPAPDAARIQELLRTEEHYHLLANHIHEVIFTMDMDFKYTYISPSVEHQRGFTV